MPEITLVLGVDAKTLPQFEVSHRTWKLHQPKIWSWPWVVFYDSAIAETFVSMAVRLVDGGIVPENTMFVAWPDNCLPVDANAPKYEHQREKMLSGFPYVAADFVRTPGWCKIDTDAICHRASDWPNEEWFKPLDGPAPSVIAPGWGYTKGIDFLDRLEKWGDRTMLGTLPRLNIPSEPGQLRVPHPRWCSWNSFYDTAWTESIVGWLADSGLERGKLPVPSQDSWMWYCAERSKRIVRKVNMKRRGWNNYPKLDKLIEAAQSVMRGDAQEAMSDG